MSNSPSILFLTPEVDKPTGGLNHLYKLCQLANELGINAKVLSPKPYIFVDPPELNRYWVFAKNEAQVGYGDLIVTPEIWKNKPLFNKPVRRITYIQNWGVSYEKQIHQRCFWYYGQTHLNHIIFRLKPPAEKEIEFINGENDEAVKNNFKRSAGASIELCEVPPYFNENDFSSSPNRDRRRIIALPRRCNSIINALKKEYPIDTYDNIQPAELRSKYGKYGIFLYLSPCEGLGYPPIEALLSGTSVITWPNGGSDEFMLDGFTASVAKYYDINDLRTKIEALLVNDIEQVRLAENGRKLVSQLFTRDRAKIRLLQAYHTALKLEPEL